MAKRRYCAMCDEWFPMRAKECPECGLDLETGETDDPIRKLTRHEQLEALADAGCDTWEEFRCER